MPSKIVITITEDDKKGIDVCTETVSCGNETENGAAWAFHPYVAALFKRIWKDLDEEKRND